MPQTLTVAVCICNEVTFSDFIPPMEMFSYLNLTHDATNPAFAMEVGEVPYRFHIEYLAPTLTPVAGMTPSALPTVNPTNTYGAAIKSGKQYDIIWVPAGPIADPVTGEDRTPKEEIEFIKHQAPGAKYIMSVCGGSVALATAGILDGKRATTNKKFFRLISAVTTKKITWVPRARWVIDENIWTSSGVAAGSDMALAFIEHLAGAKAARLVRGAVEIPDNGGSENDPFAEFHGLV